MNDNLLRKAVDARLSGLTFTPQMQADTLRRAHPAGSTRMGRKLSYSLAFALLALLLAATAGAAAYFGVLHFHGEQENNAVYQRHILSIGERLTGQNTTVTVNDAVFDGSSLSFSLDIAHVPNTPEVYLYPRVTATQDGRVIATHVTEFQQLSADESYGLSASLSGFGLYEGIFMPARGIGKAEQGYYSLDVSLLEALPHPEKPVEWSLTFDVLHPVFALEDAPYTVTEEEDGGVSYTWNTATEDCLNAYREGRILIDSVGFLMDYAFALPAPDGMTAAQWEQADLGTRLTASGAFSLSEQLTARFVTDGAPIASIRSPQTFSVGDYACTLSKLTLTFARLEYEMTVALPDGASAADAFENGEPTLDFKLTVPNGQAIAQSTSVSTQADGSLCLSGVYALTQPADSVTFTPILPGHLGEEDDWLADDYEPTEEERKMAFTVKAQ